MQLAQPQINLDEINDVSINIYNPANQDVQVVKDSISTKNLPHPWNGIKRMWDQLDFFICAIFDYQISQNSQNSARSIHLYDVTLKIFLMMDNIHDFAKDKRGLETKSENICVGTKFRDILVEQLNIYIYNNFTSLQNDELTNVNSNFYIVFKKNYIEFLQQDNMSNFDDILKFYLMPIKNKCLFTNNLFSSDWEVSVISILNKYGRIQSIRYMKQSNTNIRKVLNRNESTLMTDQFQSDKQAQDYEVKNFMPSEQDIQIEIGNLNSRLVSLRQSKALESKNLKQLSFSDDEEKEKEKLKINQKYDGDISSLESQIRQKNNKLSLVKPPNERVKKTRRGADARTTEQLSRIQGKIELLSTVFGGLLKKLNWGRDTTGANEGKLINLILSSGDLNFYIKDKEVVIPHKTRTFLATAFFDGCKGTTPGNSFSTLVKKDREEGEEFKFSFDLNFSTSSSNKVSYNYDSSKSSEQLSRKFPDHFGEGKSHDEKNEDCNIEKTCTLPGDQKCIWERVDKIGVTVQDDPSSIKRKKDHPPIIPQDCINMSQPDDDDAIAATPDTGVAASSSDTGVAASSSDTGVAANVIGGGAEDHLGDQKQRLRGLFAKERNEKYNIKRQDINDNLLENYRNFEKIITESSTKLDKKRSDYYIPESKQCQELQLASPSDPNKGINKFIETTDFFLTLKALGDYAQCMEAEKRKIIFFSQDGIQFVIGSKLGAMMIKNDVESSTKKMAITPDEDVNIQIQKYTNASSSFNWSSETLVFKIFELFLEEVKTNGFWFMPTNPDNVKDEFKPIILNQANLRTNHFELFKLCFNLIKANKIAVINKMYNVDDAEQDVQKIQEEIKEIKETQETQTIKRRGDQIQRKIEGLNSKLQSASEKLVKLQEAKDTEGKELSEYASNFWYSGNVKYVNENQDILGFLQTIKKDVMKFQISKMINCIINTPKQQKMFQNPK